MPAGAGDRQTFEALFERHHRAVLAYCLRRVRERSDAEDAASEAFAIAWRRLGDMPADPLPWLYAIARRVLANQRRGAGRWASLLERLRLQSPASAPGRSTAGPALEALDELRDDDQELLRLAAWEELSHAEIAAALGISTNAVAIRLHRARQRYAEAYSRLGGQRVKGSSAGRTSIPVTGSSTGSWRHDEA